MTYQGSCHCGDVEVCIALSQPAPETDVTACQCSFCRRHGAGTVSDALGQARITSKAGTRMSSYRFGLATAEFLLCARCGVYIGAVIDIEDKSYATINVVGLAVPAFASHQPKAVTYDGEDVEARILRRRNRWTPAVIATEPGRIISPTK
ncbi:MAG: hypothetical protein V3V97_11620 [Hyphomicrobiaceae bacterium]